MSNPFNTGPIAPERNPPIEPDWFEPSVFTISDIARGATTTVTTSVDHNYVVGQVVRLNIPTPFGMQQINMQQANVISIPADDEVVLNIVSTPYNAFNPSPTHYTTSPVIAAIGDVNTGYISSTGRSVPFVGIDGSFINISPSIGG